MMGKIWSMAHTSGMDWNTEKLQKYLSASFSLISSRISAGRRRASSEASRRQVAKYSVSARARWARSSTPWVYMAWASDSQWAKSW
jgi:hypothetical protein